jgi:DNA repair protein RadA
MHQILKIADLYNMIVLCTNQVQSSPAQAYGDPTMPVGGHIVGHNSTFRIYMRPGKAGSIYCKLMDSPNLPNSDANFYVKKEGFANE